MIEKCPKCGQESYIELPGCRVMKDSLGCLLYVADEYRYKCHSNQCNYESELFTKKTKLGEWLDLPWWKRIFTRI